MTDRHAISGTPPSAAQPAPLSAGMQLQLAREDAGLTLDAVASQLKLAPRQVQAIENDDFALLPGRTFVRGFVRNYARLLQLDADAVVAALPGGSASSLDSPALHATGATMGELPALAQRSRSSWARWMIPLTLLAVVAAAAMYELSRVNDGSGFSMWRHETTGSTAVEPSATPLPQAAPAPAAGSAANQLLPNPLANKESGDAAKATSALPSASATVGAPTAGTAPPAAPGPDATISITYHDKSWTTIRDRDGNVLVSKLIPGGQEQTITGAPPFDVVIGNATEVSLNYKGEVIDLTPYIRSGVARLALR